MRQCIFVIGTRAQLVKVAPVLRLASEAGLGHAVWFTGQHNESIDDLVRDFGIAADFVRRSSDRERSSIFRLLAWLPGTLLGCYRYIASVKQSTGRKPLVIVHGDTLSTYLGALAGRIARGRVVHLESGLSSGKLTDPFPEELLRRLTFRMTDYALCPNDAAAERMRRYDCEVVATGENTLLDCVRYATRSAPGASEPGNSGYFVASVHRFQNIYSRARLKKIVDELVAVADLGRVHFILHPPTRARLAKYGLLRVLEAADGVELRPRMAYTEFLALLAAARGVFSDGGSNQEELAYLGVPTILFRKRSERPDGLGANVVLYDATMHPLVQFIKSGKFDALRAPSRLDVAAQPSRVTLDAILGWAR